MAAFREIPVEYLKEALRYDSETGLLFWSESRPAHHFTEPARHKRYMTMLSGKVAGTIVCFDKADYYLVHIKRKTYFAHRIAWAIIYGAWPSSILDHENGNGLDNRRSNLRLSDSLSNAKNNRVGQNNKSGFGGVRFDKRTGKWLAYAKLNYQDHNLGLHETREEAIAARQRFNSENGFSPRHGRPHIAALAASNGGGAS